MKLYGGCQILDDAELSQIEEVQSQAPSELVNQQTMIDSEAESSKLLHSILRDIGTRPKEFRVLSSTRGILKRKVRQSQMTVLAKLELKKQVATANKLSLMARWRRIKMAAELQ